MIKDGVLGYNKLKLLFIINWFLFFFNSSSVSMKVKRGKSTLTFLGQSKIKACYYYRHRTILHS